MKRLQIWFRFWVQRMAIFFRFDPFRWADPWWQLEQWIERRSVRCQSEQRSIELEYEHRVSVRFWLGAIRET